MKAISGGSFQIGADYSNVAKEIREINQLIKGLEDYLGNRYSPRTVGNYTYHARQFLQTMGVKSGYDRTDILKYVDRLIERKYKRRSITSMLDGVKYLFHVMNWPWPLRPRDLHIGLPEGKTEAPVISNDDIAKMIYGVQGAPYPYPQLVALSTMFGLRNIELTRAMGAGCDGQKLIIQTAKLGDIREHKIPDALSGILTFKPMVMSGDTVHRAFDAVMKAYVRPPKTGEGFHAVRRSLVTNLINQHIHPYVLAKFMGWTIARETPYTYYHPTPEAVEIEIMQAHPFYPIWVKTLGGKHS